MIPRLAAAFPWLAPLAVAAAFGVFVGLGVFTFGYGEGYAYLGNDPKSCVNCHVMQDAYDSWQKSSHHAVAVCVDCHLPNDNIMEHLVWKGIDGGWDFFAFHTGLYSEPIRITEHGRKVVQGNCVRCHGHMVSRISTEGLECSKCHRSVNHKVNIHNALR